MRAAVGPLKKTLIKPSTLKSYQFSLKLFYLWLAFWSLSWPSDRDELDTLVSQFAELPGKKANPDQSSPAWYPEYLTWCHLYETHCSAQEG